MIKQTIIVRTISKAYSHYTRILNVCYHLLSNGVGIAATVIFHMMQSCHLPSGHYVTMSYPVILLMAIFLPIPSSLSKRSMFYNAASYPLPDDHHYAVCHLVTSLLTAILQRAIPSPLHFLSYSIFSLVALVLQLLSSLLPH
jgi:hypothetical protein